MLNYIKKDNRFILRYIQGDYGHLSGLAIAYKLLIKHKINIHNFNIENQDISPKKVSNDTFSSYYQFEFTSEKQAIKYIDKFHWT